MTRRVRTQNTSDGGYFDGTRDKKYPRVPTIFTMLPSAAIALMTRTREIYRPKGRYAREYRVCRSLIVSQRTVARNRRDRFVEKNKKQNTRIQKKEQTNEEKQKLTSPVKSFLLLALLTTVPCSVTVKRAKYTSLISISRFVESARVLAVWLCACVGSSMKHVVIARWGSMPLATLGLSENSPFFLRFSLGNLPQRARAHIFHLPQRETRTFVRVKFYNENRNRADTTPRFTELVGTMKHDYISSRHFRNKVIALA